jgi:hypothetical protein
MKSFVTPLTIAKSLAPIGFLALSVLAIAPAQAVVIDFESLNSINTTVLGPTYIEQGFSMTNSNGSSNAYAVWGNLDAYFSGSTTLAHNLPNTTTTLAQVSGGAFTLSSIGLGDNVNSGIITTVAFTGNLAGGGTVFESFTTDSAPGLETFNFNPSFTNLASVQLTLTAGNQYIQFDNIDVSGSFTAVPEPFTVLGTTLLGAGSSVVLKRKLAKQDKQDIG